jgi:uncharacterized membrane protein
MADDTRRTPPYHKVLFGALSTPGVVLGAILLWFSFGSSLLPREPMMQGVLGALSFAFGYAIGVLVWFLVKWVAKLVSKPIPKDAGPTWLRWVAIGSVGAIFIVEILRWPTWQSEQRLLVGLDELSATSGLMAVVWTLAFTLVLVFIGRSIRWLVWKVDVFNEHHMSPHIARGVSVAINVGIVGGVSWFIASSGLTAFANERFGPGDDTTLEGITQPTEPEYSGSPESLVQWDDLGFQGRTFAGSGTTVEDMAALSPDAQSSPLVPIRVYAGLKSTDSTEERAQLVVEELNRTNAEDRAIVILVSTTGTGWVDPIAASTVEYMYNGDTAIAAMQYSFLPSWISFILDTATATEAGVAINDAVIEWWEGLPENDRPRLVAFGESLGTLGSEAAYAAADLDASLQSLQSKVEGALWVGPTNANEIHSQYIDERDPSPVWKPTYNGGAIVRTFNGPGEFDAAADSWAKPRVLYYHHPSDPVGYWNWETLWKPQEWTDKPVGYDVPDSVRWIPFTTFTQVVVDLINGFSASVGHGHNYNDVFTDGWSVIAPLEGWTDADTAGVEGHVSSLDLPGL